MGAGGSGLQRDLDNLQGDVKEAGAARRPPTSTAWGAASTAAAPVGRPRRAATVARLPGRLCADTRRRTCAAHGRAHARRRSVAGDLAVLGWLRAQVPPCRWDARACAAAAASGHRALLAWMRSGPEPCPWGRGRLLGAAPALKAAAAARAAAEAAARGPSAIADTLAAAAAAAARAATAGGPSLMAGPSPSPPRAPTQPAGSPVRSGP